jgi:lipopolysaccharide/colanic/teichoic acid biosynthesis glycosyltransferase
MLQSNQKVLKRILDIWLALLGIFLSLPFLLLLILLSSLSTRSSGWFRQKRIGKDAVSFKLYKLKTMRTHKEVDSFVTKANDPRITKFGRFLRKTKLDELPQLWNVLIGNMSFVGPRPDVPGYADQLQGEDRIILSVKPGITGPASLAFKDEEDLLARQNDPQRYNDEVIWPKKVAINKDYIKNYSLITDIRIIWKTIFG